MGLIEVRNASRASLVPFSAPFLHFMLWHSHMNFFSFSLPLFLSVSLSLSLFPSYSLQALCSYICTFVILVVVFRCEVLVYGNIYLCNAFQQFIM